LRGFKLPRLAALIFPGPKRSKVRVV